MQIIGPQQKAKKKKKQVELTKTRFQGLYNTKASHQRLIEIYLI